LKTVSPLDNVIQVHVPSFVDFLTPMSGCNKRHLANQYFGFVHGRTTVEAWWCAVPQVSNERCAHLIGNILPSQAKIAKLIAT